MRLASRRPGCTLLPLCCLHPQGCCCALKGCQLWSARPLLDRCHCCAATMPDAAPCYCAADALLFPPPKQDPRALKFRPLQLKRTPEISARQIRAGTSWYGRSEGTPARWRRTPARAQPVVATVVRDRHGTLLSRPADRLGVLPLTLPRLLAVCSCGACLLLAQGRVPASQMRQIGAVLPSFVTRRR